MTGERVSGLMKKENPMLVNVHCLAHRLAASLCTSQAATDIPALKGYQQIIIDIYYYFRKSAKRTAGIKRVQEALESDVLVGFPSTMHFMPFTVPGVHFATHAKANRFLKKITQYEFIGITHFLMDIIPITTQLNLVFQKEDLDLAAVTPVVETTLQPVKFSCERGKHRRELKEKIKQEGSDSTLEEHLIKVNKNQKSAVQKAKDDFVVALGVNFQKRFPKESMSVITAFEVLSQVQKLTIMAMKS